MPDADSTIDGLIAAVPNQDWQALDIREGAYDRVAAAHQVTHTLAHQPDIAVYSIPHGKHGAPTEKHPVLLSYIDVVVQGYLTEFGESGAARFFATTDGWDAPVINDRHAPLYPRHCMLTGDERRFVDAELGRLSVKVLDQPPVCDPTTWRE